MNAFLTRLDDILPWDAATVDKTALIKRQLSDHVTPIGPNDTAIAGHALATKAILVTNNMREIERVEGLPLEDWSN